MDNDNLLVQKAADLYRGLRFKMKYRGVPILSAGAGNDLARDLLESGQPFLFGRCGATEMRTAADYLHNGGRPFADRTRADIRNLSGVFPTDDAALERFCKLYIRTAQSAELLALWNVGAEREVIRGCDATRFTELRALEPYYHARPWSAALAGKRVLVVHPFRKTILSQYEKRAQLFPGRDILPEFASLTVIQAVQGLAGQDTGYDSWFDALDAMERKMDAADYDVAIIGAGAYGLPLAAHARDTGHAAIQMSGATQLLFGIKGRRWDDHPVISKLYNPAWVRPDESEGITNKEKVEGGSYWYSENIMRILMISNHLGVQSGVQRYVQNLLLNLDTDRYQIDLFVGQCPPDQTSTAPALEAHGVHIIAVPDHKKDRIRALAAHLRTHRDYDIIHYHTASKIGAPVCGMMRLLCPRAKIVVHSHIVYPPLTLTWRAAHLVYQLFADYFLGCGVAAGRFVFGSHIDEKPNFSVACNAVDQERFHPDAAARAATRRAYGIADTDRLAGFVGRLNHQKNPLFLMEVFAAMAAQDVRWKLMLVGTGEKEPEMRAAAEAHGLTDRVIFAGVQSDVPAFMNAFDLFLLPSNFEGSPVTLVEAQGCGVPCLASTNVPDDGSVTELVHFLPLAAPLSDWAAKADAIAPGGDHADHWQTLAAAGYELKTAARRMEQLYDKLGGQP